MVPIGRNSVTSLSTISYIWLNKNIVRARPMNATLSCLVIVFADEHKRRQEMETSQQQELTAGRLSWY